MGFSFFLRNFFCQKVCLASSYYCQMFSAKFSQRDCKADKYKKVEIFKRKMCKKIKGKLNI